jgi:hypothetical protein
MARSNHSMTGALWAFQRKRKKWWLGPIILVLSPRAGVGRGAVHLHDLLMRDVSPRALRKFGLTVGGVFLLLGAMSWWRGHLIAPRVM